VGTLGQPFFDIGDPVQDPSPPQPDERRSAAVATPSLRRPWRYQISLVQTVFIDVLTRHRAPPWIVTMAPEIRAGSARRQEVPAYFCGDVPVSDA
jgi:hypothetical protein